MKKIKLKRRHFFEMHYQNVYSCLDDIEFVLLGMQENDKKSIFGKFLSINEVTSFNKFSMLHKFIDFVLKESEYEFLSEKTDIIEDSLINENSDELLNACSLLKIYSIKYIDFFFWLKLKKISKDKINKEIILNYYKKIDKPWSLARSYLAEEIFFLLFQNRECLRSFNEGIASVRGKGECERKKIPVWAQKAIMYRDRGKCVVCYSDISGMLSLTNNKNYDHIVPFAKGGIDDVTNIQLLCESCNKKKSCSNSSTSSYYEKWY